MLPFLPLVEPPFLFVGFQNRPHRCLLTGKLWKASCSERHPLETLQNSYLHRQYGGGFCPQFTNSSAIILIIISNSTNQDRSHSIVLLGIGKTLVKPLVNTSGWYIFKNCDNQVHLRVIMFYMSRFKLVKESPLVPPTRTPSSPMRVDGMPVYGMCAACCVLVSRFLANSSWVSGWLYFVLKSVLWKLTPQIPRIQKLNIFFRGFFLWFFSSLPTDKIPAMVFNQ